MSILVATIVTGSAVSAEHVWIEGEKPLESRIMKNGWYESADATRLSGAGWMTHYGDLPGQASYQFSNTAKGTYRLWLRANPIKSSLQMRVDGGQWNAIVFNDRAFDTTNVAADNKPDLRFVAWVNAGDFKLSSGVHSISFRFESSNKNHGAIDCFCLVSDLKWKPSGMLRPGEARPHWSAPKINEANLEQWMKFIQPSDDELGWQNIRWHSDLSEAAVEAKDLNRPILLWAMNGHPCGET